MAYFIGVDIGGMSIKAGLITKAGEIIAKQTVVTERNTASAAEIMLKIAALITELIQAQGLEQKDICAIGLGMPGTVDNERGLVLFAGNIGFKNIALRSYLREQGLSIPLYIGNDANVAALAESRIGAGQNCQSSVMITLGTGLGSGVVINNRLYAGFNGAGCELGHTVIAQGGLPCSCGRRGCMEAYCSATALLRQIAEAAAQNPSSLLAEKLQAAGGELSGQLLFAAETEGDPTATAVVEQYIHYLGEAMANIVNNFFPQYIILGGGISGQGEAFRSRVAAATASKTFLVGDLPQTEIVLASLGNDAGIVGAAFFAADCLLDGLKG